MFFLKVVSMAAGVIGGIWISLLQFIYMMVFDSSASDVVWMMKVNILTIFK